MEELEIENVGVFRIYAIERPTSAVEKKRTIRLCLPLRLCFSRSPYQTYPFRVHFQHSPILQFDSSVFSPSSYSNTTSTKEMDVPTSWDALRKQARKLEAQLDEQMNSYRKVVSAKASVKVDATEKDLESGIDRLLLQLQQVNSQMQVWVSSGGSEMVSHTLTRHQEICQDLTQEFHRLRSSLRAKQEHASLLDDFRELDRSRLDLEDGVGSTEQALLKEHASISRNTGQMDTVISQAQATLGALVFQRSTFGGVNSKLSNISSRLPTVNQILTSIKRKKSMDTIILSLVASVCTFLIFIYWLTK